MDKNKKEQHIFYKVNEVSQILKTTSKTVRTYIHTNQLNAHQLPNNGGYRIHKDDLQTFLDGLKIG